MARDDQPAKTTRSAHPNVGLVREGERPCPICGQPMGTETELGVTIDVCEEHGVWLDKGELVSLQCRIQARERHLKHLAKEPAPRPGKLSRVFFGWLRHVWK